MSQKHTTGVEVGDFQPIDPWKSASSSFGAASRHTWKWPGLPTSKPLSYVSLSFEIPASSPSMHLVMTMIQEQDRRTIDLDAAVVMPDHVHAIFRVIEPYTLSQVLHHIKGRSSRQINTRSSIAKVASGWWRASTTSYGMPTSWKRRRNTSGRIRPNKAWKITQTAIGGCS